MTLSNRCRGRWAFALLAVVAASACTSAREATFEEPACGLMVRMPGQPRPALRTAKTRGGNLTFRWYTLEIPRDLLRSQRFKNFLEVGCAPLPPDMETVEARSTIESALAEELGGVSIARRVIRGSGYEAIEFQVQRPSFLYVTRIVFAQGRLIQLRAGKSGNAWLVGREAKFMDSLEIRSFEPTVFSTPGRYFDPTYPDPFRRPNSGSVQKRTVAPAKIAASQT